MTELPAREGADDRSGSIHGVMGPKSRVVVGAGMGVGIVLATVYALWNLLLLSLDGWPPYVGFTALFLGIVLACLLATPTALRLLGRGVSELSEAGPDRRAYLGPEKPAAAVNAAADDDAKHRATKQAERQLLEAIERHGEVTPVRAALETALTVAEADRMLGELAEKGHLEVRVRDGKLVYSF